MITPLPGDRDARPGAAMRPYFGVRPVLLDEHGARTDRRDVRAIRTGG